MDIDLSLDEIIERKRIRAGDKKFQPNYNKPRKLVNKPQFKPTKPSSLLHPQQQQQTARTYDARNKIIEKTRAKIADARDILNKNMRHSGIDARQLLLDRKKQRHMSGQTESSPSPPPLPPPKRGGGDAVHKGHFGQRMITMGSRADGMIETLWDPKEARPKGNAYKSQGQQQQPYLPRVTKSVQPFAPRGYVDHDNMQELEAAEITRALHYAKMDELPSGGYQYGGYKMDMDDGQLIAPPSSEPFGIYEAARNRIERPALLPPLVGRSDTGEKLFERRQRSMVASSNLPESLRARLFGGEPDRRTSHGIYANENGTQDNLRLVGSNSGDQRRHLVRRSPPPMPLGAANHKPGYRLLVSNLHANVSTSDIRELFNELGPMYDAHVVRPGTAEVIYKTLEDAENAVDTYHQREFDGQPMHCVLVNPHSSNRSNAPASSRTVTTNSSGVEVDIDALYTVLFRDR